MKKINIMLIMSLILSLILVYAVPASDNQTNTTNTTEQNETAQQGIEAVQSTKVEIKEKSSGEDTARIISEEELEMPISESSKRFVFFLIATNIVTLLILSYVFYNNRRMRALEKKLSKRAEHLKNYIKKYLSHGYTNEAIKESMTKQGITEEEVEKIFNDIMAGK